jgi:hypothetical protein
MHRSNFKRPSRIRQLAICACALAAVFAGPGAHARTGSRLRPVISGTPPTSDVAGNPYTFTPTARGPSGHTLTFSISDKPAWASFDKANGRLTGTPTTANVGQYANIVIRVSDGVARASLPAFAITVSAPSNTAPTIAGTPPATATVGTLYTFTPSASDSDGDALSFSVQNMPSWASFSIASGTLSGTPAAGNVGTNSNIVISVSDGHTSASLAPFSITVASAPSSGSTGSATVTWTAPTTNTDGTALTDLAGFHIYYGQSPSSMTTTIDVANAGTTSYTVNDLASGTWYFAVNAYTTSGAESALSTTGSKSIP